MGHSYYFEGSISVTPSLNFTELKKARMIALKTIVSTVDKRYANADNVFESYMPLRFELDSFTKDTDEGPLHVTRGIALVPANSSDGGYAYHMKDLVEALIKGLPGHNWSGTVMAIDDDRRSAVKIIVTTGKDTSTVTQVNGTAYVKWENGDDPTPVEHISG
jgi:hypothetical protein